MVDQIKEQCQHVLLELSNEYLETLIKLKENHKATYLGLGIDNWIAISGVFLALLIFIYERRHNYKKTVRDTKSNWFLTIIVTPKLEELNLFYSKAESDLTLYLLELNLITSNVNRMVFIRRKNDEFKKKRVDFLNNFSSLIKSFDESLSKDFDIKVNGLIDVYTETLDQAGIIGANTGENNHITRIYKNKSELFSLLFNVIKKDKSYFSKILIYIKKLVNKLT